MWLEEQPIESHILFSLDAQVISDLRHVLRLGENDPMPATGKDLVK